MTTYNEGDWITATHPDGYTVSGPMEPTIAGDALILLLPGLSWRYPHELEADGYTITPGKPADLSNPTDDYVRGLEDQRAKDVTVAEALWFFGEHAAARKAGAMEVAGILRDPERSADMLRAIAMRAVLDAAAVEPEPVQVPQGVGAVVLDQYQNEYHRFKDDWRDRSGAPFLESYIAQALRSGGKVLSEGVEL